MEHEVVGKLQARVAAWRHGNPARVLKIIAVAGLYGKTTTALMLGELLQEAGSSVMTLTSEGCLHNGERIGDDYDTSAGTLQHCLSVARKKNVGYVVLEVSDALVATQVLPTLFITMSVVTGESESAKALLEQPVDYMVVPSGFDVAELSVASHQAISFGEDESAEAQIANVTELRKGTEIDLIIDHQTKLSVATYLVGRANVSNVAAAISAAYVLATDTSAFEEGVARLERVIGNYEHISTGELPYEVIVDAATHETSIASVLTSAYKLKKRRLLVVADSTITSEHYGLLKRLSDRAVIIGDAPEFPGLERAETIESGFELMRRGAKKDDVILLLGKTFAARQDDGATKAESLVKATGE